MSIQYMYIIYTEVIHILSVHIMRNLQKDRYLKDPSFRKYQCHSKKICLCMYIICVMYCYILSEKFISVKYKWFQPNRKMCDVAIFSPTIETNIQKNDWKDTQTRGSYDLCCNLTLPLGSKVGLPPCACSCGVFSVAVMLCIEGSLEACGNNNNYNNNNNNNDNDNDNDNNNNNNNIF